jgi:hypothetical protein
MDEQISSTLNKNRSQESDKPSTLIAGGKLPEGDRVIRIVLTTDKDKKDKSIPAVRCFSLSPADKEDDYKLSTDWEAKTTPEESVARVGCTLKTGTRNLKPYKNRELYGLRIADVIIIPGVEEVIYDPLFYEEEIFGKPNNNAHASIRFNQENYNNNEPEILTKLRQSAISNKIEVDMSKVDRIVTEYKARFENQKG